MLSRSELRRLRALQRRKGREESGEFLAEGVRLVEELLASAVVPSLALLAPSVEDTPRGTRLARRLRASLRTVDVSEAELAELAGTESPQGVVVVAGIRRATLSSFSPADDLLMVVLDAVQDPGNFGTIVRSADAFGAQLIAALPGTVDPWNPKAVRSAMGSSFRIPITETTHEDLGGFLRQHGIRALGAAADGRDAGRLERARRVALVLGNEGAGLTPATRALCDDVIAVPIRGSAESLNVGVAAGILLYVLSREM